MSDLSSKTCLVCCAPLFVSFAERLARDFGKVYVYVPHHSNFPQMHKGMVGDGLENVERVDDVFGDHFDKVDLFVFPDLGKSALQVHLEGLGKRVWGARYGEELETYRELCKEKMEEMGLPVQPWRVVTGITALREFLKKHPGQHVKIDRWRGLTESFFAPRYDLVEPKLDDIAHSLGAYREKLPFILEDDLPDRVEVGVDTYCIDGEYPSRTLVGIECKDLGYVGQVRPWASIPEPLRRWNERFAPLFLKAGYRGNVSNEIRIGADMKPYMIDATLRMPSPPGELMQELVLNLAELMWQGADGVLIEPKMAGKWGVDVVIKSPWARDHHLPVQIPKEFRQFVKLYNNVRVDGKDYVLTQEEDMHEIGAVVGFGDTLDAAVEMAREVGESVEAYGLKFGMGPVDEVREQIAEIEEIGVSPFQLESGGASP